MGGEARNLASMPQFFGLPEITWSARSAKAMNNTIFRSHRP